jgi:hypothetical protein
MLDPGMLLSSNFKCKLEKLPKKQLFAYEQLGLKSQQTNGSNHHVLMTVELHVPPINVPTLSPFIAFAMLPGLDRLKTTTVMKKLGAMSFF